PRMDWGAPLHPARQRGGVSRGANELGAKFTLLAAAGGAGRRMVSVRGRSPALVAPSLFSRPRGPRRLLPPNASPRGLAVLPALVPVVSDGRARAVTDRADRGCPR